MNKSYSESPNDITYANLSQGRNRKIKRIRANF